MVKHIFVGFGRHKFDIGLITVEPVLFLYMFANFLYFPVLQSLIFDKVCYTKCPSEEVCEELKSNRSFKYNDDCQYHEVNSETSHWILRTTIALTAPSFVIVLLVLGAIGDKINRKIPVILSCVGALSAYISGILNAHFMSASLYFILIGPLINGFCGGFIACLMSVYSYVGDIASERSKMIRVGIVESMVFLAGTIGVFVSGIIVERQGYIVTFGVISIATAIAIIYSILWLDSLTPNNSRSTEQSCSSLISTFFKESYRCATKRRAAQIVMAVALQVLVLDVLMLCTSGDMDVSFIYLRESLNFSSTLYGYYKGLDNFMRGLILITVLPLIKKYFKIGNLTLVLVGLASFAANFVILGVATEKWMPFLAATVGMFKGVPSAGLRATMSSMVSKEEQGRLFGLIAASESLISLFASLMFNELYPATYYVYHGLVYLLAAGLVVIVFFLIMFLIVTLRFDPDEPQQYQQFLSEPIVEEDLGTVQHEVIG